MSQIKGLYGMTPMLYMNMDKEHIIEAMHNRLREIDPHVKAFLFGSRARGTEHEGSDWDVLFGRQAQGDIAGL